MGWVAKLSRARSGAEGMRRKPHSRMKQIQILEEWDGGEITVVVCSLWMINVHRHLGLPEALLKSWYNGAINGLVQAAKRRARGVPVTEEPGHHG